MRNTICSDCGNPMDVEFVCSHCEQSVCSTCASLDSVDEDVIDLLLEEEDGVAFTLCRYCLGTEIR